MSSAPTPRPAQWRDNARARLSLDQFDVLVVGGGITGAGVARDAVLRGLRVAIVERDDFASGTSSRSSRLVHGGVRYLEHGFLHLVFEASRERRLLLDLAPGLVRPLRLTWPVYHGDRIPRWKLGAGLWLYDLLALFRNVQRHRRLGPDEVLACEPLLESGQLAGGATFFDAATDDARLTLAVVEDAVRAGAVALNHAEAVALLGAAGPATGVRVRDIIGGETFAVRATVIVNATGPWTDTMRRLENPATQAAVIGTKGVHVLVPAARAGNRGALIFLSAQDGRELFVLPAGSHTLIGTTDTTTREHPEQVRASRADVQYLLDSVNARFPQAALTFDDVVSAWAGIRPLVASWGGGDPARASREHEISVGPRGIVTVTGGKLTTYRAVGEQVVDLVVKSLGRAASRSATRSRALPGAPSHAAAVPSAAAPLVEGLPYTLNDVERAATVEFACTIADVLVRRTKVAFETRDHGWSVAPVVGSTLAKLLGWSDTRLLAAIEEYRSEVARLFSIDD